MFFSAKEGAVFLKADEGQGVEVHSSQPIQVTANQDATFTSKRLTMTAAESLHITCGASSIVLDGNTDMQGNLVEMEGSNKSLAPSGSGENQGEMDLQMALTVDGMIPSGGAANA